MYIFGAHLNLLVLWWYPLWCIAVMFLGTLFFLSTAHKNYNIFFTTPPPFLFHGHTPAFLDLLNPVSFSFLLRIPAGQNTVVTVSILIYFLFYLIPFFLPFWYIYTFFVLLVLYFLVWLPEIYPSLNYIFPSSLHGWMVSVSSDSNICVFDCDSSWKASEI